VGRDGQGMADQIAALPVARDRRGRLTVLMVTSRETGRWVMPKGWIEDGAKPWQAAATEALEEAGATGAVAREAIGSYRYDKRLEDGTLLPCRVRLLPMRVDRLKRRWKARAGCTSPTSPTCCGASGRRAAPSMSGWRASSTTSEACRGAGGARGPLQSPRPPRITAPRQTGARHDP